MVPLSSTLRPGRNFRVAGLGVASVWMNMGFLRRRRFKAGAWVTLSRWRQPTHDQGGNSPYARRPGPIIPVNRLFSVTYDSASISASLSPPETMVTGIGNEPAASAIWVTNGPGPSGPGL